jgi:hypothetical protein
VRKRFATDEIYSQPHYLTLVLKNMGSIASVFRLNGTGKSWPFAEKTP